MADEKMGWENPELIVMVRSKAEERVLGACKSTPNPGPNSGDTECFDSATSCSDCANPSFS